MRLADKDSDNSLLSDSSSSLQHASAGIRSQVGLQRGSQMNKKVGQLEISAIYSVFQSVVFCSYVSLSLIINGA